MMRIYRTNQLHNPGGITGLGKTKFWEAVKTGDFPPPNVILSERFRGWTSDIVDAWIESKRNDSQR
jgi:predicted DNA-binding transcriptional regulator AlpA